jgi:hypothetical protein
MFLFHKWLLSLIKTLDTKLLHNVEILNILLPMNEVNMKHF